MNEILNLPTEKRWLIKNFIFRFQSLERTRIACQVKCDSTSIVVSIVSVRVANILSVRRPAVLNRDAILKQTLF